MSIWEENPQLATKVETKKIFTKLKGLDSSNMLDAIVEMPKQIEAALKASKNYNEGEIPIDTSHVHLLGLGGSAIAGDVLNDILTPSKKISVHYGTLPPRDKRGVIVTSYSGDTLEIVKLAHRVTGGLKANVFITSGGKLAHLGWEWSLPVWRMPLGYQPRAAIGWSLGLLVATMVRWRILNPAVQDRLKLAAERLSASLAEDEVFAHPLVRAALPIAKEVKKRNVIVLHSLSTTGAARRMVSQLNENAKHPAFALVMPEGLHNSIEGIAGGKPDDWMMIFLADQNDPDHLREGMANSAEMLTARGFKCVAIPSAGNDQYELTLSRLFLADFISILLAGIKGIDPTPIPAISELKAMIPQEVEEELEDDDSSVEESDGTDAPERAEESDGSDAPEGADESKEADELDAK